MPEQQLGPTLMKVEAGWHVFHADDAVAVLTLSAPALPAFVEVTASPARPAYAKLAAGTYEVKVQASREPAACRFDRLCGARLGLFFVREALRRLARGDSFAVLAGHVRRAVTRSGGFGAAAQAPLPAAAGGAPEAGPLALAVSVEMDRSETSAPAKGPRIFVTMAASDAALARQTWRNFTTDPAQRPSCDFVLNLPDGTQLAARALEALAAPVIAGPALQAVYADAFVADHPTFAFGYDRRLNSHADTLSDLVLVRRDLADAGGSLSGLDPASIYRLSQPLARLPGAMNTLVTGIRAAPSPPSPTGAGITCIVPTRDRADLLAEIVSGLLDGSDGVAELIVIDNGSVEPETHALFERLKRRGVVVVRDAGAFNFSRLCNLGAAHAKSPILAFVNNDIRVARRDWLVNMARWAVLSDVGAVGTRLLYDDGSLQHGGVALGLSGHCGHLFRGWPRSAWETIPSLVHASTRSAVTAAALMVEATKFHAAGGFNERDFPVTLNDVDLCLRLKTHGWSTVYEPAGEAFHPESRSRGHDLTPDKRERREGEIRAFITRWHDEIGRETWFSPLLSRAHEEVRLL